MVDVIILTILDHLIILKELIPYRILFFLPIILHMLLFLWLINYTRNRQNFTSCFALCILLSVTLRFNKLLDQRWTLEQLEILLDNSKTEKSCQPSFYGNNGKVSLEFLLLFICPNYLMRQIMYSEV